jgi:hypothetical protein
MIRMLNRFKTSKMLLVRTPIYYFIKKNDLYNPNGANERNMTNKINRTSDLNSTNVLND